MFQVHLMKERYSELDRPLLGHLRKCLRVHLGVVVKRFGFSANTLCN